MRLLRLHPSKEDAEDGHTEQASPTRLEITRAEVLHEWVLVRYSVYDLPTSVVPAHDVPRGWAEVAPAHQLVACACSYRMSSDGSHVTGMLAIGPRRWPELPDRHTAGSSPTVRITALFSPLARSDRFDEHSCELRIEATHGIVTALSARMR